MQVVSAQEQPEARERPYFFAIPVQKLAALWLGSLGLYGLYWFHQHWQAIGDRENASFKPWHRMLLAGSYCEPLLQLFLDARVNAPEAKPYKPRARAVVWLAMTATLFLGPPLSLLCPLAFLPLLDGQRTANAVNAERTPKADTNARFRGVDWLALLPGVLVLVLGAAWCVETCIRMRH